MDERQNELGAVLAEVRRRWNRRARLGAWTIGAMTAATMFGVGLFTVWLLASEGLALAFVVLVVTAFVLVTLASAARPPHHPPTDLQIARYIEEQAGGLDDVVVTAVQHGETGSPIARGAGAGRRTHGGRRRTGARDQRRGAAPRRDRRGRSRPSPWLWASRRLRRR